jgi:hypothetical protein
MSLEDTVGNSTDAELRQESLDALTFGRRILGELRASGTVSEEIFAQSRVDGACAKASRYYEQGEVSLKEVRFWCFKVPIRAMWAWRRSIAQRTRRNLDPRLGQILVLLNAERFVEAERILREIENRITEQAAKNRSDLEGAGNPVSS